MQCLRLRRMILRACLAGFSLLVIMTGWVPGAAIAQGVSLPPVSLDVLDGYLWSVPELWMAPGQELHLTNRDVDRHTFTVDEWGIDENLPSMTTVIVNIPEDAQIGTTVQFYSSVLDDRELGLQGTINIVSPEDVLAGINIVPNLNPTEVESRVRINTRDDFSFDPALVTVAPGTLLEVVNEGVIEHHFAVDDWGINQTISPGSMALVRVPDTAEVGSTVEFYCSMPGHQQQGMVGILRVTGNSNDITTVVRASDGTNVVPIDMRPFLPDAESLGEGWERLRSGSSESILGTAPLHEDVFPYSGQGAVYVGPGGARVTIVALPLETSDIPLSQVNSAMSDVESILSESWTIDQVAGAAWRSIAPPNGCTVANRVSGIVPTITMPSGVTSCQLTGVGIALFVAVEGGYQGEQGVHGSDMIVSRIVSGATGGRRSRL